METSDPQVERLRGQYDGSWKTIGGDAEGWAEEGTEGMEGTTGRGAIVRAKWSVEGRGRACAAAA